jgi:DNA-binding transcriptional LysR family regulator
MTKTCEWRTLSSEVLILLAPRKMVVRDPFITAAREPFILCNRKVVAGKMADNYLRSHDVKPKVRFELDGIEHIARLVAEGFGVSILPGRPSERLTDGPNATPCPNRVRHVKQN